MELQLNAGVLETIEAYRLPRFAEIPTVGLYLNQVVKYINGYTSPFADMALTESMVSNYVKKGLVANPVKKQYDADQIAHVLFIAFAKTVLSMDNIRELFTLRQQHHESAQAYDFFCNEFEAVLQAVYAQKGIPHLPPDRESDATLLCRNVIVAVVHKLYLDHCFQAMPEPLAD
ncbi:MAG: DUF1836 domain-containing protein [Coriobacteriia bacterium]|nr:DUF1836 domain-containing protein [Coriobacteriia bacterium]